AATPFPRDGRPPPRGAHPGWLVRCCRILSARPPVVLLHSGGFTSRQWRRLRERLTPRFDFAAPDFLGYGSRGPWSDGEPFHFHRDVELVESLMREPAHLVGHSYGGLIA